MYTQKIYIYIYMHVRVIYVNIIYRYIERDATRNVHIYIYTHMSVYVCSILSWLYICIYIIFVVFYLFSFFAANPAAMMSLSQQIVFFKRSFGFLIYILYFWVWYICSVMFGLFEISLLKNTVYSSRCPWMGTRKHSYNPQPSNKPWIWAQPNIQQGLIQGSAQKQNN